MCEGDGEGEVRQGLPVSLIGWWSQQGCSQVLLMVTKVCMQVGSTTLVIVEELFQAVKQGCHRTACHG